MAGHPGRAASSRGEGGTGGNRKGAASHPRQAAGTPGLDLLELTEYAWHNCYEEITPPDQVIRNILICSLRRLGHDGPGGEARSFGVAGPPAMGRGRAGQE
jgi:hypothetical protein